MPQIVVDDDGVMVLLSWAELAGTLSNANPALLLEAIGARLQTGGPPHAPPQRVMGRDRARLMATMSRRRMRPPRHNHRVTQAGDRRWMAGSA